MKKYNYFILIILALFILKNECYANDANTRHHKLIMHGQAYPNSCTLSEKKKMNADLRRRMLPEWRNLATAIEIILCRSESSINAISNIVDKTVVMTYEGTAEEKFVKSSSDEKEILKEIMADGEAWNARLLVNAGKVKLQYFSSEACVESVSFHHSQKGWLVSDIGGACD